MTTSKRILIIALILSTVIAIDQATKWVAIYYLSNSETIYRFGCDIFRLQYAENTGAFLSLGAGLPDGIRASIMTGLNTVILSALIIYIFLGKKITMLPLCAFSLVAAGGIGNLIDRIFRQGRVVDFMNMGITVNQFPLRTGIFNVADVDIMAGLFLIIAIEFLHLFSGKSKNEPAR